MYHWWEAQTHSTDIHTSILWLLTACLMKAWKIPSGILPGKIQTVSLHDHDNTSNNLCETRNSACQVLIKDKLWCKKAAPNYMHASEVPEVFFHTWKNIVCWGQKKVQIQNLCARHARINIWREDGGGGAGGITLNPKQKTQAHTVTSCNKPTNTSMRSNSWK